MLKQNQWGIDMMKGFRRKRGINYLTDTALEHISIYASGKERITVLRQGTMPAHWPDVKPLLLTSRRKKRTML